MDRTLTVLTWLIRIVFLAQLAMGLSIWFGNYLQVIPYHTENGNVFIYLFWAVAILAAVNRVGWKWVIFALVWGLVVGMFGYTQMRILPGHYHWVIRIAHLAVGLFAMYVAETLLKKAKTKRAIRAQEVKG